MEKKIGFACLFACALLFASSRPASAGVEPSPFQPEINKLHSIELHISAINNRLAKFSNAEVLPDGSQNYLDAMALQMDSLSVRLSETLAALPAPSLQLPYTGQDEVLFSLDAIREESGGMNQIIDSIASRMGIEPSPFKIGSLQLISDIDVHLIPVLPPLDPPELTVP